jgi:hypothetical protein
MSKQKTIGMMAIIGLSTVVAHAQGTVKVGGDIRVREEYIDAEGKDARNRLRLRARLNVDGTVTESVKTNFRVSSGNEKDPVSTNQSLGDFFGKKSAILDIASITWSPKSLQGLAFTGGKMKNPLDTIGKDMIWDNDLTPEGIAAVLPIGDDAFKVTATAGGFQVVERSSDDETYLYAGTLAADTKLGEGQTLRVGAGFFQFDNLKGFPLFRDDSDALKAFGNSEVKEIDPVDGKTVLSSVYKSDYSVAEGFVKLGLDVGFPVSVYGDYAINNDAETSDDTAYMGGFTVGVAKDPGSFEIDYNFRSVEADAVFGGFTDSDSFGGGTNGEGHRVQLTYAVDKNTTAGITYFKNETGINKTAKDYDRIMVDFVVKF